MYILGALHEVNWTVPGFLEELLNQNHPEGIDKRTRVVASMLNGSSKPHMASLLAKMFKVASTETPFLKNDTTIKPGTNMFNPDLDPNEIRHAYPAMTTWVVRLVSQLVNEEAKKMIDQKTGLHHRAHAKEGSRHEKNRIAWEAVQSFSFLKLEDIAKANAPVMSFLMNSYAHSEFSNADPGDSVLLRTYRPENLVVTNALMLLTFGRSDRANLYQLCRALWMFATKTARTVFRVESRIGQSVAHSTVYKALSEMAKQKQSELKASVQAGKDKIVVSDNVQVYARKRDRRIGRENKMITGLAGTAIEMQDYHPDALNLQDILQRQARQERRTLTADTILNDLDPTHLENVSVIQFLQALIGHVKQLSVYHQELAEYAKILDKKPIPKTRCSKITPLATNSADEMHIQGLKRGVLDFISTQMGVTAETLNNRAVIMSGDGKTYAMFLLLKKICAAEEGDFESFRWLVPLLELWHTKWTDLSRDIRAHWGSTDDPSSLASIARIAECPTPSDLRKVDFYDGSYLVNLALDANLLNCWELYFKTDNLTAYFSSPNLNLPSFDELRDTARILVNHHATTQAYNRACYPGEDREHGAHDFAPTGKPWIPPHDPEQEENEDIEMACDDNEPEPLPEPPSREDGDFTLANSALFMRDAIWWKEVCKAVAEGDPGRVWEILKIWIFTFGGSGNPHYCNFLLEMYCMLKWEVKPELRDAILLNWVVNRAGKPGHCIEMDLLQEHSNFWLEDLAQHKGKEFDEPFYRQVISPNVQEFLGLKEEMEEVVALKVRSKMHGKTDTSNELKAVMKELRDEETNCYRAGRKQGEVVSDDFAKGMQVLRKNKIKDFLGKSTVFADVLKMHDINFDPADSSVLADLGMELIDELDSLEELEGDGRFHAQMVEIDGQIYTMSQASDRKF
ncbi:hypothetical protein BDZ97DRAFT_1658861 [Flammula alnicola]|nr:hypothetical protein BDZ97DRAFT_1658861 [Flammula alnicola]